MSLDGTSTRSPRILPLVIVAIGLALVLTACAPPPGPPQGGPFNPSQDTNLPAGSYTYDSVDIPAGVTVTLAGNVEMTVKGDTVIDGSIAATRAKLTLLASGALSIDGSIELLSTDAPGLRLQAQQNSPDTPLGEQPLGFVVVVDGLITIGSGASVTVDGPVVITDDAGVLEMTPSEVNDDADSASGDLPTLVLLDSDDPIFATSPQAAPAPAVAPQQEQPSHVLGGTFDQSGLAGEQSVFLVDLSEPGDLVLDGFVLTMAGGQDGEDADASGPAARAVGSGGERAPRSYIRVTSGRIRVPSDSLPSRMDLGDGAHGGSGTRSCGTAFGGDGREPGSIRLIAAGGIDLARRVDIDPGTAGNGGNATVTGGTGCDGEAHAGNGANHRRRLFTRGNVSIDNLVIGDVRAGDGGTALVTIGDRTQNDDPCTNGRRGGNATAHGGNGGDAVLDLGNTSNVSAGNAIGGDPGAATATGGNGETSGPGECKGTPGGNGGAGGRATANGGDGGDAETSGAAIVGNAADTLNVAIIGSAIPKPGGDATAGGGDGGNGAHSCTPPLQGGKGADGGRATANAGTGTQDGVFDSIGGDGGNGGNGDPVGQMGDGGRGRGTGTPGEASNGEDGTDGGPCGPSTPEADLSLEKSDDIDPMAAGGTLTYTVTVSNAGPNDAENVVVTDTLPAGVTVVSTSGCAEDPNGVPTCTLGDISAMSSEQFIVVVAVGSGTTGTITNTVSVSSDTDDPDPGNNETTEETTVSAPTGASDDSYDSLGNVGVTVPAGNGVLANDAGTNLIVTEVQGDAGNVGVPIATDQTGAGGVSGSVTVASDGSIIYDPPPGFAGTDTFTYTLSSDDGPDSGTVSITTSDMIWFIDNSASGSNSGTLADPFQSIAGFNASQGTSRPSAVEGDIVFVFSGTGNLADGITLQDGQLLIGQGAGDSIVNTTGMTLPPFSDPLPSTGGTSPVITNTGGDGITLASDNTIRGLDIGNTGAGFTGINDSGPVGSLVIQEVNVIGTGGILDINNGGTLDITLGTAQSTSHSGFAAIGTVGVSGSLTIVNTDLGAVNRGVFVQGGTGPNFDFGDTTVSSTTHGIDITSAASGTFTFDSLDITTSSGTGLLSDTSSTINIGGTANTISASGGPALDIANTSAGSGWTFSSISSTGSTTHGISLQNSTGTFTFSDTTVSNATDVGITISNASDTGSSFTFDTVDISITGGDGISLDNVGGNITVGGGFIQSAGDDAVEANQVGPGTFTLTNTVIPGPSGFTVNLTDSNVAGTGNAATPFSCNDGGGNTGSISFSGGSQSCP